MGRKFFNMKRRSKDEEIPWKPSGGVETYVHSGLTEPEGFTSDIFMGVPDPRTIEVYKILKGTYEAEQAANGDPDAIREIRKRGTAAFMALGGFEMEDGEEESS
jgi:hypothetical protein